MQEKRIPIEDFGAEYPHVAADYERRGLDQVEAVEAMRSAMHVWDKLEKIARREYPGVAEQEIFRLVSRAFEHITGLDKVLGA